MEAVGGGARDAVRFRELGDTWKEGIRRSRTPWRLSVEGENITKMHWKVSMAGRHLQGFLERVRERRKAAAEVTKGRNT